MDVSRETRGKLDKHLSEVRRWNPKINLVAKSSLEDAWTRHIDDSTQIYHGWNGLGSHWLDLGSGGGYPGLVVAILAQELTPWLKVTLVDSDQRKCAFLAHVARLVDVTVDVRCSRIESLTSMNADVVSARALAPLDQLLTLTVDHMAPGAVALFAKGVRYAAEIAEARRSWTFDCDIMPSRTDAAGAVLKMRNITHA